MNDNQKQLVNQLTRLNQSLKTELQKCHAYIQCLQNQLKQGESNKASNLKNLLDNNESQNVNDQNKKNQQIQLLRNDAEVLHLKYTQKKHQLKTLEKSYNFLFNKLQNTIKEQKQTIQLYNKELQNKSQIISNLQNILEEITQKQKQLRIQNRQLRKTNQKITLDISNLQIKYKQNKLSFERQLKQSKQYDQIIEDRSTPPKPIIIKKLYGSNIDLMVTPKDRYIKQLQKKLELVQQKSVSQITKKSQQQHLKLQEVLYQKQQLGKQIQRLVQQRDSQKQRIEKLKSDFIEIKLQNSNLLAYKNKLVSENKILLRQKSQLISNNNATGKVVQIQNQRNIGNSIKKCFNKSYSGFRSGQMTPKNDDQIPVKDYSSTKLKYYVNNTFGDDLKQCFSRQNSHKQSSFRL